MIEITFRESRLTFMKKAYSYLRFSHPSQVAGDSIRRQVEDTEEFCRINGFTLDEQLKFRDEGVSAFTGEHRNDPDRHALAYFLKLANDGKIEPNSYLIIENLDRLSRESTRKALALFISILDKQINIVQLHPETIFDHENCNEWDLMRAILELSRGHSESSHKSRRVGDAWQKKRTNADKEKLTAACPSWLKLSTDRKKFDLIPTAVKTVKLIFTLCIDGYGTAAIASKLNTDQVPPIGRASYWAPSYIMKILRTRSVLGEYQPHTGRKKTKRRPDGQVVANYYPSIISIETFYAAQSALKSRRNQRGRTSNQVKNLFTGLLHDARDKCSLVMKGGGGPKSPDVLVSYLSTLGKGNFVSFPYAIFERAIIGTLREIDPSDLQSKTIDNLSLLLAQKEEVDSKLLKIEEALLTDSDLSVLIQTAKKLVARQKQLAAEIEKCHLERSTKESEVLNETQSLLKLANQNDVDLRTKLKAHIRQLITEIWVVFHSDGATRFAFMQVRFRNAVRSITVRYKPKVNGFQAADEQMQVISYKADFIKPEYDLRDHYEFVVPLFEDLFPSSESIAKQIAAQDMPNSQKIAVWKESTGKSASDYYRKVKQHS